MATRATSVPSKRNSRKPPAPGRRPARKAVRKGIVQTQLEDALKMAESAGWLAGPRDRIVRGRMPAKLVAEAKKRSGITSDSKLIEAALARVAAVDDYLDWLIANRGTVDPTLDLDF